MVPAFGGPNAPLRRSGSGRDWMADGESILWRSTDAPGACQVLHRGFGRPPAQSDSPEIYRQPPDGAILGTASRWPSSLHNCDGSYGEQGMFTISLPDGTLVLSKDRMNLRPRQGLAWALASLVWSPSGTAVYAESMQQWKSDLWRFAVNAESLELVNAERLTTGAGIHQVRPSRRTENASPTARTHNLSDSGRFRSTQPPAASRVRLPPITDSSARAMTSTSLAMAGSSPMFSLGKAVAARNSG